MTPSKHEWIGLDHVQLAAPIGCEEEARRFFAGVLGMQEVPKPEKLRVRGGVWFQCGPQMVHIGVEPSFVPAKKAHPAFLVSNIEALMRRLEEMVFRSVSMMRFPACFACLRRIRLATVWSSWGWSRAWGSTFMQKKTDTCTAAERRMTVGVKRYWPM